MEYLPIYSQISHDKINTDIFRKRSPQKLELMLEPIVFHLICIINKSHESRLYFDRLYQFLGEGPDVTEEAENLAKLTNTHAGSLIIPLKCFHIVTSKTNKNYKLDDLTSWLASINSKTIRESYNNLQTPPPFVLFDIMMRNPQFREEFLLQKDIWTANMKNFALLRIGLVSILRDIIDNLIYYSIMFETGYLQTIIEESLKFFKSSRTGVNVDLGNDFINEVIWNLAVYSSKYRDIDHAVVANAQEILISYFSLVDDLTFKAYIGISIVISRVSYERGQKLLSVAEKKFQNKPKTLKDLVAYYLARIHLCNTPDDLTHVFGVAVSKFPMSSKLWLFFIRRLNEFGTLDEIKAKKILNQLLAINVNVTSDIVTELVRHIGDLSVLQSMVNSVDSKTASFFIKKYIQLAGVHEGPLPKFPWSQLILSTLPMTSIENVGLLLQHKAKTSPQRVFHIYKEKLLDKKLSPNKACLQALLTVALHDGDTVLWNGFTAPEIAVIEFQKHARTRNVGLIPNEGLWWLYIKLLIKHDYVSELSKIMKWWEDLRFEPSKQLLLTLLSSLPKEFAERHIKHHEKAHLKRDWPWPSIDEFNAYTVNRE
ncbi:hypothetical protein Cantr_06038 [Candida viswanathii]|uniref:Uncharacterized protein n=1 Tax=Candida viswanathii TaxID=5486 RepID=A0A367XVS0_9ASCO|nr:hypothetical protein Cantr_06038 [Candida viswanathii]